ncbi:MAG TPA: 6-carboxytetrahydropterin synthase QueD [Candidatus Wallbacteria bacterium]|nr:6-carboxytetrahydropterin synthase QueD [Candidatus Wallbacteria bacterium]
MYEISAKFSISSAHFLREYEGKCANLHGHNWKITVHVSGEMLKNNGMLVDFGELKALMKSVEEELDHKCLNDIDIFKSKNPTAENIAEYIYLRMSRLLVESGNGHAAISRVSVFETENCEAVYTPPSPIMS